LKLKKFLDLSINDVLEFLIYTATTYAESPERDSENRKGIAEIKILRVLCERPE
jgi:hypothetical protein